MEACYYSKYEPIFGSWHIVEKSGSGGEGNLYRIRREDALGNEYFSALKAITIRSPGESVFEEPEKVEDHTATEPILDTPLHDTGKVILSFLAFFFLN